MECERVGCYSGSHITCGAGLVVHLAWQAGRYQPRAVVLSRSKSESRVPQGVTVTLCDRGCDGQGVIWGWGCTIDSWVVKVQSLWMCSLSSGCRQV